jgi:hypothetical protein
MAPCYVIDSTVGWSFGEPQRLQLLDERLGKANSTPRVLHSRIAAILGATDSSSQNSRTREERRPLRLVPAPPSESRTHTCRRGLGCLFPIKHKDGFGLALAHQTHGHRQGLEIFRKLDLPGVRNLALEFVGDFQTVPVHAAARRYGAWSDVRTEVRIIVPIELDVLSHLGRGTIKGKAVTFVGLGSAWPVSPVIRIKSGWSKWHAISRWRNRVFGGQKIFTP